jgi:hypothetical protein
MDQMEQIGVCSENWDQDLLRESVQAVWARICQALRDQDVIDLLAA